MQYAVYGDYLVTEKDSIQEAKAALLKGMISAITEIAEQDRFWIVNTLEDGKVTVGWKIHIPQMDIE